jgi:hypothetical protein
MKRYLSLAIAIMMFMTLATITAEAQVFGSKEIKARIPFSFNVGSRTLPAGDYTVKVLNPNSDRSVLQIRSRDGRLSALIHANGITSKDQNNAKLVFNRYGDTYSTKSRAIEVSRRSKFLPSKRATELSARRSWGTPCAAERNRPEVERLRVCCL